MSTPTTRSRTLLFISYRDSRARSTRSRSRRVYDDAPDDLNANESERLISPGLSGSSAQDHVSLDFDLPPRWVDVSEQIEDILTGTQAKISTLERLHAKHVLPGFTDRTAEEREIEATTSDITKDFRQCHSLIKRIGEQQQQHTFPPGSASLSQQQSSHDDALAAKNVQRALAAKVQQLSATFRKKQRVYMEKLQGHAIKNQDLLIASGTVSLRGSEGLSAVDDDIEAATTQTIQAQTQTQAQAQPQVSRELLERDRELRHIAESIGDLAELFKDLSVLVIDQGTLLDSVEYNIERTAESVREAVGELEVATRYQKNTGRRKCILLLLLIIFGLIIVLIFKPRRHGPPSPPPPPPPPLLPAESQSAMEAARRILS